MNFYVLITGSRKEHSRQRIENGLNRAVRYFSRRPSNKNDMILIDGDAPGADRLARNVAKVWGWDSINYPADWDKHGARAGCIRNQEMVDVIKGVAKDPDNEVVCVAFPLQDSKGTWDCIRRCVFQGIPVIIEPEL